VTHCKDGHELDYSCLQNERFTLLYCLCVAAEYWSHDVNSLVVSMRKASVPGLLFCVILARTWMQASAVFLAMNVQRIQRGGV
jgi:hypothetical protein